MSGKTRTRADLAQAVYERIGLSRVESAGLVEAAIDEMVEALARGEDMKVSGFGSFILLDRAERTARNPRTGEAAPVSARRVAVFRPSNTLKARMNAAQGQPRSTAPGALEG